MKWRKVKLGEVCYQDKKSSVNVEIDKSYSMVGVYSFGRGLFFKEPILGFHTSYKKFYKLKKGQIVLSQLFGWEGAISYVDKEYENFYVSSQFPTFLTDENLADIKFISYYLKQGYVWQQLFAKGKGMGSRRRTLNPDIFLNLEISLPPLAEQKRIVAKLDAVKSKIEKIKQLRAEQEREIRNFQSSFFEDLLKTEENIQIEEVLIPKRENIELKPVEEYRQITVRMNHQGVDLRGYILGQDVGSKQYLASENDFIISKIDARNAAMGIVPKELHGAIVTNDFPLYKFTDEIRVKYFDYFSNTFYFDNACKNASEGTTNRRRLKKDKFESILMPKPSIKKQDEIIEKLDKLNAIKTGHEKTINDLNELLPSLLDKAFKGELQ